MDEILTHKAADELYTIQDMLRWAITSFQKAKLYYGHGTDNPWDEAVQLIFYSLSLPLDMPPDMYNARLTSQERKEIVSHIMQRVNERIPVAYITNKAFFCGKEYYVDQRVLVPRSPIGELINNRFANLLTKTPHYILDLCTGSGCLAIACAHAFPDAEIDAVDISEEALEVAEYNIQQHGVEQQVTPLHADLFSDLLPIQYGLIISNPPYVDADDMADLPPEFRFEPELGLAAGNDGLQLVRRILANAADFLDDEGILICEVGNSMLHLIEQYPMVPFTWLQFSCGGEGVFLLTKPQLQTYKHYFFEPIA